MAFTYTAGSTADRDRLRLEIGDTNVDRKLFDDEELDDILLREVTVIPAAAKCCENLSVKCAQDFNFSADGSSFDKATGSER